MEALLLLLLSGLVVSKLIRKSAKNSSNFSPMPIRVEIGKYDDENKGYPFIYTTDVGSSYVLYFPQGDALEAIKEAEERGIEIIDYALITGNNNEAQKDIVSFKYRDLGDGVYYVKIEYRDGTKREGKCDNEVLQLYIRDANRVNTTIETF